MKYYLAGGTILFAGVLIGMTYFRNQPVEQRVESDQLEQVSGTTIEAPAANSNPAPANSNPSSPSPTPPVSPSPQPNTTAPSPARGEGSKVKTIADPCIAAKSQRTKAEAEAQKNYDADASAAKQAYDQAVPALDLQLSQLANERNQAINSYLTAIALATSKYNSSAKTASDYSIYKQEQDLALTTYNQAVALITTKETDASVQKEGHKISYDQALVSAKTKQDQSLAAASAAYSAKCDK